MKIIQEELDVRFIYHTPSFEQIERLRQIRSLGKEFAELIVENTPESREQSLAITKVEEAIMHANAAIVRRETS